MLKNRMIYVAVLLILCLFRIAYTGYVAGMLLLMALILPIFSWLISLPGAIYTQVLLTVPDQVVRGGEATLTLTLRQSRLFATGAVRGKLRTTNALTGEVKKIKLKSVYDGFPLDTAHCCQYECSLKGLRILDLMGLFPMPVKKVAPVTVTIVPFPSEPLVLSSLPGPSPAAATPMTCGNTAPAIPSAPSTGKRAPHWTKPWCGIRWSRWSALPPSGWIGVRTPTDGIWCWISWPGA